MKHFFTISLCFLALGFSAQEPDGLCCDPDGTNYNFINCLQSGCCGVYNNDGCVEDPDCSNYNQNSGCLCNGGQDEFGECDCDGNVFDECGVCGGNAICLVCGDGTYWDSELGQCLVTYPSDSNFDSCVDLTDLMDLLSAYGLCLDPE